MDQGLFDHFDQLFSKLMKQDKVGIFDWKSKPYDLMDHLFEEYSVRLSCLRKTTGMHFLVHGPLQQQFLDLRQDKWRFESR
jgi:hypothetical protein